MLDLVRRLSYRFETDFVFGTKDAKVPSMTELTFPGGSVRIDEGQVWDALTTWLLETGGHVVPYREAGIYHCLLHSSQVFQGKSRLSMSDAVAQALQIAASA